MSTTPSPSLAGSIAVYVKDLGVWSVAIVCGALVSFISTALSSPSWIILPSLGALLLIGPFFIHRAMSVRIRDLEAELHAERSQRPPPTPDQRLNYLRAICDSLIESGNANYSIANGAEPEHALRCAEDYHRQAYTLVRSFLTESASRREVLDLDERVHHPDLSMAGQEGPQPTEMIHATQSWLIEFRDRATTLMMRLDNQPIP